MNNSIQSQNSLCYLVLVSGVLSLKWNSYFGNFFIHTQGEEWTLLCGDSADQSALLGALEKLHNLGLELNFAVKTTLQKANQLSPDIKKVEDFSISFIK